MEKTQERVRRREVLAKHCDRFAAMPDPFLLRRHGFQQDRTVADVVAALSETGPQLMVTTAIADHEVGHTSKQFAALGKMPTERTTSVVDERESHAISLARSLNDQWLFIDCSASP